MVAVLGVGVLVFAALLIRSLRALRIYGRLERLLPDERRAELKAARERGDNLTVHLLTQSGTGFPPFRAAAALACLVALAAWLVSIVAPTDHAPHTESKFENFREVIERPPAYPPRD